MSGIIGTSGTKSGIIGHGEVGYEEGTWTPVIHMGTTVQSVGTSDGSYTKIGKTVICNVSVTDINESGTGNLKCSLPFTSATISGVNSAVLVRWGDIDCAPSTSLQGFISHTGVAQFEFQLLNGTGYQAAVTNVQAAGTYQLYGMSWTYTIA